MCAYVRVCACMCVNVRVCEFIRVIVVLANLALGQSPWKLQRFVFVSLLVGIDIISYFSLLSVITLLSLTSL